MENNTYSFHIDGHDINVTTAETVARYGPHYGLTETDIERYAARYVAQLKYYGQCPVWLDKSLVRQLLDEQRLMKPGESDGFKLQLTFSWYIVLKKENKKYLPFQYSVCAYCLDNIQSFGRRYPSLSDALLHCLNGFNENAAIPDRYASIGHYLTSNC